VGIIYRGTVKPVLRYKLISPERALLQKSVFIQSELTIKKMEYRIFYTINFEIGIKECYTKREYWKRTMKNINIPYTGPADLDGLADSILSYPADRVLIQIFAGTSDNTLIERVIGILQDRFPGYYIAGARSSGEISDGQVLENSIIIGFSLFEKTRVKTLLIEQNEDQKEAAQTALSYLKEDRPKGIIVFGCGVKSDYLSNDIVFLQSIKSALPDTVIAGGQSGGIIGPKDHSLVFTEKGSTAHGYACAFLFGDHLHLNRGYNLSWTPVGMRMTITDTNGTNLYSINKQSVTDIYRHYLGIELSNQTLFEINYFPLMIEREHYTLTNPILKVNDDGSCKFAHPFKIGEQVRFSFANAGIQEEGARDLNRTLGKYKPEAAFVYSCVSRKYALGSDTKIDMTALSSIEHSIGFFTFGEYYTDDDSCVFCFQQTMTILTLSEHESFGEQVYTYNESEQYSKKDMRHFYMLKVLSKLIGSTTEELEESNRKLNIFANNDGLTGLSNRRYFDENIQELISVHRNTMSYLSFILCDVDFFKQYNDIYGHVAGDDVLRAISQVLQREIKRPTDLSFRYGGEEFGCVLSATDFKGAAGIAQKILQGVRDLSIPHRGSEKYGIITVSLGIVSLIPSRRTAPEEIVELCDKQLYQAKHKGRNRIEGFNKTL
jgi:diguanylate cyclase (GGDEF)-like protein